MSTENTIKSIVAKCLSIDVESIGVESSFEDLGADSLDVIEIIIAIENHYHKEIDDTIPPPKTIQEVVDFIEENWI